MGLIGGESRVLERKRGRLVAASHRERPALTADDVRALLEKLRR